MAGHERKIGPCTRSAARIDPGSLLLKRHS
jgi:hypothetical protein